MDTKTSLNNLITKTLQGKFDDVHQCLISTKIPLEQNGAIKFFVAICNACDKNLKTVENLNEDDLVKLIKCLLKYVKLPLKETCLNYLQSVFYILKFLLEKKCYEHVLKLEELVIPDFLPLIFKGEESTVYENMRRILYSSVVQISNSQDKQYENSVVKLCHLVIAICKKANFTKQLLESLHNFLLCLSKYEVKLEDLTTFYDHCLNQLDKIEDSTLFPNFINNFSCLYAILLNSENFQLAQTCYVTTTTKMKQLFKTKEHNTLSEIFAIIQCLNPSDNDNDNSNTLTKSHDSLKNYFFKYKSTNNLQSICDVISSVAYLTSLHYKKNPEKWLQKSHDSQSQHYNFLHDVSNILSRCPHRCRCKSCSTETNLNEALRALSSVATLNRLVVKASHVSRAYKMSLLRHLEKYLEFVDKLKENSCAKWTQYWYNGGVYLYSTGLNLQESDHEMTVVFMEKFVEYLVKFEGKNPEVVDKSLLISALNVVAEVHWQSEDYEKCLLIVALIVVFDGPRDAINRWIKVKVAARDSTVLVDNEIQELTLVSILRKHEAELARRLVRSSFELDVDKQIDLLIFELSSYKSRWKSKVSMMAALRELTKVASSVQLARVFVDIWGDCDLRVHDSVPELLRISLKKLERDTINKRDKEIKFFLAHLYFLQHKYRVKDTITKQCEEIERTMNITKAESLTILPPSDPVEQCDIVSSYDSLKLNRYLRMLKELYKSHEMIRELFTEDLEEFQEKEKLYKLLMKMGQEYKLHCQSSNSFQCWELALRVARLSKNNLYILQVANFIIQSSEINTTFNQKLIEEVEEFVTSLNETNTEEVIIYHLSKAEAYLYVNFEISKESFRQATKLFQNFKCGNYLKARFYHLEHKFNTLPCNYNVETHQEFSLVRIHQAYICACENYSDASADPSAATTLFFDICESLVKMYHDLRLPRDVRCYGQEVILLAQKLVLPLRTATFLFYLAHADTLSCLLDDSRCKIEGLSDILDLSKSEMVHNPCKKPIKENFKDILSNLAIELEEMVLDVPSQNHCNPNGSPVFKPQTFSVPDFMNHQIDCDCFRCNCLEYQEFVMKKTFLHAMLYEYESQLKIARDYFFGCIKIYNFCKNKRRTSEDLVPVGKNKFLEIYCTVLYELGNSFLRRDRTKEAENVNVKALEIVESFSLESVHLYNEVLLQKLSILVDKTEKKSSDASMSEVLNTAMIEKTPEIVKSPAPPNYERMKILPKSLKFDLSDDEEEEEKRGGGEKSLPKLVAEAKTPAPRIKIYTSKSSKKRKPLEEINRKEVSARALDFLKAPTPSAQKIVAVKEEGNFVNRTKLLTERLKNSTRKASENCEIAENKAEKVRKNLLGDLNKEEQERSGAVRRSARNKK